MNKRIEEIKDRLSKATGDEWRIGKFLTGYLEDSDKEVGLTQITTRSPQEGLEVALIANDQGDVDCQANADFIAHSKSDILYLLQQLEERDALLCDLAKEECEEGCGMDSCASCWANKYKPINLPKEG